MKRFLWTTILLLLPLPTMSQATVTVVYTDGTTQQTVVEATGEVLFGTDYMAILPSPSASTLLTYQMDEVSRVQFDGVANIVNIDGDRQLTLSPNPATDSFVLHGTGSEPQPVQVYSLGGALVLQGIYAEGEEINIGQLASGIYLVRTAGGVAKLIKE